MTVPSSPQYGAGGFVAVPAEDFAVGTIKTAASAARFVQRLDRLDEELGSAATVVGELVARLGPVLPTDFPDTYAKACRSTLAADTGVPPASPLGERLATTTERAFALVHQVRALCDAVDL